MKTRVCILSLLMVFLTLSAASAQQKQNEHKGHNVTADSKSKSGDAVQGHDKKVMMEKHFIEKMIPHHQDAIDMANLALKKSKNNEILKLSQDIIRTQTAEIETMKKWYKEWYGTDVPSPGKMNEKMKSDMKGMDMNGKSMMMMDMCMGHDMMGGTLDDLEKAPDFDAAFMDMMIKHHKMAVMMSGMVIDSSRPELRQMASDIIRAQSAEIEMMIMWRSKKAGDGGAHSGH